MKIQVSVLREGARIPTRGSAHAAGYDLYACLEHAVEIAPGGSAKIGTGLAIAIPDGYFGAIFARSGLAAKEGLRPANCVGVADSDYRGEYMVVLHNDSGTARTVRPGDRIAQLVDGLHDCIQGRIVTDCGIGAVEVVVDCSGQADDRDVVLRREDAGSGQRAVAADNNQCIDIFALHRFEGYFAALGSLELLAAGGFEDCASLLYYVADILCLERDDLIGYKTAVSAHDTFDGESVVDGRSGDGAYCGIHCGSVASRSENADTFNLSHNVSF